MTLQRSPEAFPGAARRKNLPVWPQRFREGLRRHRFWLLIGSAFLLVTLGILVLGNFGPRSSAALAVDNPGPNGAMAVARVLHSQGVTVQATDSLDATMTAVGSAGPGRSTVLLYDPGSLLDKAGLTRLAAAGPLVLVQPGPLTLRAVTGSITAAGPVPDSSASSAVPAGCSNGDAVAAGRIDAGHGQLYHGEVVCFPVRAAGAGQVRSGLFAATADGRATVLGNSAILSNDRLASSGNAALALRTLGKTPQLVWYTPSLKDLRTSAAPKDLSQLTPRWVLPAGIWLLIVACLSMLFKGRRDGPLVPEPLPVVVKAAETAVGRARLYQDARATEHAAAGLRAGTLMRLAQHFRLGAAAGVDDVLRAAVGHSNRSAAELADILVWVRPTTDAALLRWAQDLDILEKEVTSR
ncbi:DUF4350 domain-containing protein [Paenarthrobacter sp. Z7-10]|uniref:DUF4350 domain-containing protein n=1 Tax=Paenarthrobacter sp. Z7-10 TaxID=2787635 RepID=UPI0022A93E63|nr:DUF4350 domain-containing protein [Paenarthrobacter sp. Z7-10]MCZ2402772.1 DUF4350 domain-containing protein [Paenarthrobacter sp. Z7-10]